MPASVLEPLHAVEADARALEQLQEVGVGVLGDDHQVGRAAPPAAPCPPSGSGDTDAGTRPTMFDVARVVGPARHRDQALRGQDLDQHLVRGEVDRGHPLGLGDGALCARAEGEPPRENASTPAGRRRAALAEARAAAPRPVTRPPRSRQEVGEDEAVALHHLAPPHRHRASNIGPSQAKVWNSPFSPQGSTPAGRSPSRARSKARPAKDAGSTRGSTQVRRRAGRRRSSPRRAPAWAVPTAGRAAEAGARHPLLAVAADVLEEQVAERHGRRRPGSARRRGRRPWPPRRPRSGRARGCGR